MTKQLLHEHPNMRTIPALRYAAVLITAIVSACGGGQPSAPGEQDASAPTIHVAPSTATLVSLGATVQFAATARDAAGRIIPGKAFTWTSNDGNVATVSDSGLVMAIANGQTFITASADGIQDSASLTVSQIAVRLNVKPDSLVLTAIGDTARLTGQVFDANDSIVVDAPLAWSSGNPTAVTVDTTGLVTALRRGTVAIAAQSGAVRDSAVIAARLPIVVVTPRGSGLSGVGSTLIAMAEFRDSADNAIGGKTFSWTSLNPTVATIEPGTGLVTAVTSGQAIIQATADGLGGYGLITVNVAEASPAMTWDSVASPTDTSMYSVWGYSADDVWAGAIGSILHFDGTAWTVALDTGLPTSAFITGIWGSQADDVWAIAAPQTFLHFDGASWSKVPSQEDFGPTGIWGSAPNDIWVSGSFGIGHYDGDAWRRVKVPLISADVEFVGIWGTAADDIWVVANSATRPDVALHYDGKDWQIVTISFGINNASVWAASSSDVWIVGATRKHFDGSSWSVSTTDANGTRIESGMRSVYGTAPADVYSAGVPQIADGVVSESGLLHFDGAAWQYLSNPVSTQLNAIWGRAPGVVWMVGEYGAIIRGRRQ